MSEPRLHALVPAAGRGTRFGGDGPPKQFLPVAGRPLLAWTVEQLLASGVAAVTVAVEEGLLDEAARLAGAGPRVRFVAGGASRQESVARCLEACGAEGGLVLVHDGARPAVAPEDVRRTVEAAREADGAVLGRPLGDTLKRLEDDRIVETVDRRRLFRAETPQVFRLEVLERAIEAARRDGFEGTDEAALAERLEGVRVVAVEARWPNPKLTHPADLPLIEALLTGPPLHHPM